METTGLILHPTILGCFAGWNFFHRLSESVDLEFLAGIAKQRKAFFEKVAQERHAEEVGGGAGLAQRG